MLEVRDAQVNGASATVIATTYRRTRVSPVRYHLLDHVVTLTYDGRKWRVARMTVVAES
jgi:hypothetical protein